MPPQKLRKTLSNPQEFLKLSNNPRRIPPFLEEGFSMMWMQRLPHLFKMAPCMSGCCVNSRQFAAGMVCLFGGTRQMCWSGLLATLQASKYYALLCTRLLESVDYPPPLPPPPLSFPGNGNARKRSQVGACPSTCQRAGE